MLWIKVPLDAAADMNESTICLGISNFKQNGEAVKYASSDLTALFVFKVACLHGAWHTPRKETFELFTKQSAGQTERHKIDETGVGGSEACEIYN